MFAPSPRWFAICWLFWMEEGWLLFGSAAVKVRFPMISFFRFCLSCAVNVDELSLHRYIVLEDEQVNFLMFHHLMYIYLLRHELVQVKLRWIMMRMEMEGDVCDVFQHTLLWCTELLMYNVCLRYDSRFKWTCLMFCFTPWHIFVHDSVNPNIRPNTENNKMFLNKSWHVCGCCVWNLKKN